MFRRQFFKGLSTGISVAFFGASAKARTPETKLPFHITPEFVRNTCRDKNLEIFNSLYPLGCLPTQEVGQKLIDAGWEGHIYATFIPFTGKFVSGKKTFHLLDGQFHRIDGPSIDDGNSYRYWHQYGKLHRVGGPAVEHGVRYESYHLNGLQHRADGPSVLWDGRPAGWHLYGVQMTLEEFEARTKIS